METTQDHKIRSMLIVEDEPLIRQTIERIVSTEMPHWRIDTARNGAEAVDSFGQNHHSAVVMDMHMPVMDGVQAHYEMSMICENRNWDPPIFVFITGFVPSDDLRDIVAANPNCALLLKPMSPDSIVNEIKKRITS